MSALRLTPAVIFVSGVIALIPAATAHAQDSAPGAKSQSQGQSQAPKAAPKRNQSAPPDVTAPVSTPGCGWIGKRVIHSLLRDDAVTDGNVRDAVLKNAPHTLKHLLEGEWTHPYSREKAA